MSRADVVSIAAAAWQRLGLPAPQHEGDVEAVAADDDVDVDNENNGAVASVLRDALASAGFVALRAAIVAAHNMSSAEAP
jgi:hypothetical protein